MLGIYRDQSVEQLEAKKSALTFQIQNLETQIKQRGQQNLELSRKSAQYQRLKARADRIQSLYNSLLATRNAGCQQGHQPGKRHHLPTGQRRLSGQNAAPEGAGHCRSDRPGF